MQSADAWAAALTPRLSDLFPEHAAGGLTLRAVGAPRTFTYSRLLTFDVLAAERPVVRLALKEPFGSQGADPVAEFAALQKLHRHFASQPGLTVPRPLLALKEPPALLMEAVEGQALLRLLVACRRPVNQVSLTAALRYAFKGGEWLALLHRLQRPPGAKPTPPPASQVQTSERVLLELGVSADSLITIRSHLDSLIAVVKTSRPVVLHGDFTPRNVLCGPDNAVIVLDTTLSETGPAAYDLGWFLAGLDFLNRWQLLIGGRLYDDVALAGVRLAFLAGYQRRAELPARKTVALFTATRLLQRWGQYAAHLQSTQPWLAPLLLSSQVHPYFRSRLDTVLSL